MVDRVLRDPMTLDEERRAALNLHDDSRHVRALRVAMPPLIATRPTIPMREDALLPSYAGALLDDDCER